MIDHMKLEALRQLLALTDRSDWHLIHHTVRDAVEAGMISKDTEIAYKEMVDEKLRKRRG